MCAGRTLTKKKKKENLTNNIGVHCDTVTGILKKWQLIFYGTASNPIRIRTKQYNPVQAPSEAQFSSIHYPAHYERAQAQPVRASDFDYPNADFFSTSGFQAYQDPYAGAASNVDPSMTTLDGSSGPLMTNRLPGDTAAVQLDGSLDPTRRIQHDCDPQCDVQGCYGKGPTQCVACKNYRLDKSVFTHCLLNFIPNYFAAHFVSRFHSTFTHVHIRQQLFFSL